MGTRNLTMVISKEKPVVAQYGQWDGYPSGQGSTALTFLLTCDINKFKETVSRCRFIENSKRKQNEIQKFLSDIGSPDGWMTIEQSEKYKKKYPFLTRDNGAEILSLLYNDNTDDLLWIHDSSDFVTDSLFCEWAYVIDLDKETFEVYQGFNQSPLLPTERFYSIQETIKRKKSFSGEEYYPVKHVKTYKFNELPSVDVFVNEIEELTKEDDGE